MNIMKRHSNEEIIPNEVYDSTSLQGQYVAEAKTEKAKKEKLLQVEREKLETHLEMKYLGNKEKIHATDLGVIANLKLYPREKKPDRRYNRGIDIAKEDLKLLGFLLENLKPRYRKQILNSNEMKNIIQKYLGIADLTSVVLTKEEEDDSLIHASQMLVYSLTVIKNQLPMQFHESLKDSAKPFFTLLKAIASYEHLNVQIPDVWDIDHTLAHKKS